ncbi:MAG: hypothetical protein CV087_14925 [Candidatus Brocadia sp. WS118]|nr:MAG: hypothetical protein CV087_14925 [Candidatus Brocadia sp. WS118]
MTMKNIAYAVPKSNKEVFIDPAIHRIPEMILANKHKIGRYTGEINGIPLPVLRDNARDELLRIAVRYTEGIRSLIQKDPLASSRYVRDGSRKEVSQSRVPETLSMKGRNLDSEAIKDIPIIQTGHEPILYYPGVWIKNHLAQYLATKMGGIGINMIVDNDACKMGFMHMPVLSEIPANIRKIALVEGMDDVAYEEIIFDNVERILRLREEVINVFKKNLLDETTTTTMESMQSTFEDFMNCVEICYQAGCTDMVGLLSAARCSLEADFGMDNLEVPVSWMSNTDGFYQFLLHLINDAERFAHIYNEKLAEYRTLHKIRSKANPLPDLKIAGDAVELPFWIWKAGGKRGKCYLMKEGESIKLTDGSNVFTALEKSKDFRSNMPKLRDLKDAHVKLRPRAITATIFSRLLFSDIFIHGIGGAKYDTITDEIIREFFGIDPPSFVTVSTTLFLPLEAFDVDAGAVQTLHRELKDMSYNPERYASGESCNDEEFVSRVKEKRRLLKTMAACNRDEKRRCFIRVGELNTLNLAHIGGELQAKKKEIDSAHSKLSYNEVVQFREYPLYLYPMNILKDYFLHVF